MAGERLSQLADSVPDSVMTSPMVIGGTDAIARDSRVGGGKALLIGAWRQGS